MIIDSLISVFLVIVIGRVAKQYLLPSDEAWAKIEHVTYYLLFPALITKTLATADLMTVPFLSIGLALLGANLLMFCALILSRPVLERRFAVSGPSFTSLFQGSMRWNTFIALAIAGNLHGATGVTLASVAIAALIPVLNIQSVWVLRRHGSGTGGSFLRGLVTNPFIIGTVLGLAINLSGLPMPRSLIMTLDILGRCALGMGLLLVGAGLRIADLSKPTLPLVLGVVLRLVALPLIGAGLGILMGLSGPALAILVLCLGVPAASAAYLLARNMGGDAPLMAAILTAQTLVSALTLPVLLFLFSP